MYQQLRQLVNFRNIHSLSKRIIFLIIFFIAHLKSLKQSRNALKLKPRCTTCILASRSKTLGKLKVSQPSISQLQTFSMCLFCLHFVWKDKQLQQMEKKNNIPFIMKPFTLNSICCVFLHGKLRILCYKSRASYKFEKKL